MFNLQGSEIIFILLLALVILGPEKLPGAIRRFTRTYAELKKMGSGFQDELKSALDEPMREMRETADAIKDSADPARLVGDEPDRPEKQPTPPPADEKEPPAPNDPFGRPGVSATAASPNGASAGHVDPSGDPFADPTDEEADEEAST